MSNIRLAKVVGFRKYYPVMHFSNIRQAVRARHLIVRKRKSIGYTDIKVLREGKGAYSLLARTRRKRKMGMRVLKEVQRKYGGY